MSLRKILLIVLAVIVMIPATSNATVTRVIGMGGSANFILHDAYNSAVWPQLVKHYGMQGGAEFYTSANGWDFQKAYINYDFGDDKSVLQFSIDKLNDRQFGWATDDLAPLDAVAGGYNKLDITYGRPMGDVLVGAAIHYGGKSYKEDDTGSNVDQSYSEMGILLGVTALENKLDASLGFMTGSWSMDQGGQTQAEADGASSIMLAARYWHNVNDNYALIPLFALATHDDGAKNDASSASMKEMMFRLGVGNNWTPKEDMLAIWELGIQSTSTDYEQTGADKATDSEMDIYWRLGLESKIFSWLNGRFGAERAWAGGTLESIPGKPEISTNFSQTYLGASAHWNRFVADVLVNPDFVGWGPNFVSGYNDMLFWRTSLKINFDKE